MCRKGWKKIRDTGTFTIKDEGVGGIIQDGQIQWMKETNREKRLQKG
jgi:hypothetical protein